MFLKRQTVSISHFFTSSKQLKVVLELHKANQLGGNFFFHFSSSFLFFSACLLAWKLLEYYAAFSSFEKPSSNRGLSAPYILPQLLHFGHMMMMMVMKTEKRSRCKRTTNRQRKPLERANKSRDKEEELRALNSKLGGISFPLFRNEPSKEERQRQQQQQQQALCASPLSIHCIQYNKHS